MTPVVKRILIINAVAWFITVVLRRMGSVFPYNELILTPVKVYPGLHIWQLFTYMWLHAVDDFTHILFNSLFLWMFGGELELRWGSKAFLKFYIICGVGAGVIVFIIGDIFYPFIATVGASGAIYGLVAAWAIAYPNRIVYIFGVFPMKGRYFALFPIGYAFLDFLVGTGSGVSHAAHLGGLAIGALLVTGYWKPRRMRNKIKYYNLKRKLRLIEGQKNRNRPGPPGGYWN
jgi:membrane associated rhomboid family serine protease